MSGLVVMRKMFLIIIEVRLITTEEVDISYHIHIIYHIYYQTNLFSTNTKSVLVLHPDGKYTNCVTTHLIFKTVMMMTLVVALT